MGNCGMGAGVSAGRPSGTKGRLPPAGGNLLQPLGEAVGEQDEVALRGEGPQVGIWAQVREGW